MQWGFEVTLLVCVSFLSKKVFYSFQASDDETVIPHPASLTEPVMFSYRGKGNLFAKKTVRQLCCNLCSYHGITYGIVSTRRLQVIIMTGLHAMDMALGFQVELEFL